MKNIFLLLLAVMMIACTEDVLKSDYDYVPVTANLPNISMEVGEITGVSVICSASATFPSKDKDFIERGFVCATDLSFSEDVVSATASDLSFKSVVMGLKELTSYYVRAYVITADGIQYSDLKTFNTPKFVNPLKGLFGRYIEKDYVYNTETKIVEIEAEYDVEITEVPLNPYKVKLKNFWGGEEEIVMDVDMAKKLVYIYPQVIYVHSSYGDCLPFPIINDEIDDTGTAIAGSIANDGKISIGPWAATVSAGYFGVYEKTEFVPDSLYN